METGKVFKRIIPHLATASPAHRNFSLVRPISMKSKMLQQGGNDVGQTIKVYESGVGVVSMQKLRFLGGNLKSFTRLTYQFSIYSAYRLHRFKYNNFK